jgi:hypothetical protein
LGFVVRMQLYTFIEARDNWHVQREKQLALSLSKAYGPLRSMVVYRRYLPARMFIYSWLLVELSTLAFLEAR